MSSFDDFLAHLISEWQEKSREKSQDKSQDTSQEKFQNSHDAGRAGEALKSAVDKGVGASETSAGEALKSAVVMSAAQGAGATEDALQSAVVQQAPRQDQASRSEANAPRSNAWARGRTFAQAVKAASDFDSYDLPQPFKIGEKMAVKIPEEAYRAGLEVCQSSLHGRLILSKGDTPPKFAKVQQKLQSLWTSIGKWSMIILGKGYFEFKFESKEDMAKICAKTTWGLKPGILKLFMWTPDFKPQNQRLSQAQCWVRIYDLPQEYWHHLSLLSIAKCIGTPIALDQATSKRSFGVYARVLIEIDLRQKPPEDLIIEREGFSFTVNIDYENLPDFCTHCLSIGHVVSVCRKLQTKNQAKKDADSHESQEKSVAPEAAPIDAEPDVAQSDEALKSAVNLMSAAQGAGATGEALKSAVDLMSAGKALKSAVVLMSAIQGAGATGEALKSAVDSTSAGEALKSAVDLMSVVHGAGATGEALKSAVDLMSAGEALKSAVDLHGRLSRPEATPGRLSHRQPSPTQHTESAQLTTPVSGFLPTFLEVESLQTEADLDQVIIQDYRDMTNQAAAHDTRLLAKFWGDEVSDQEEEAFTPVVTKKTRNRNRLALERTHNTRQRMKLMR